MEMDAASPQCLLPAALMRLAEAGETLAAAREALAPRPGVRWLEDGWCAVLPVAGDPAVFDVAALVARDLLRRAPELRVLILPGRVEERGGEFVPRSEWLLENIRERFPEELPRGSVYLTSYAAIRLEIRRHLSDTRLHRGTLGRQVPLFRLLGEDPTARPWRSPELLHRPLPYIRRRQVEAALADHAETPALRVTGPLGCGKTRTTHHALTARGEPCLWLTARPRRHGGPGLAAQLVYHLMARHAAISAETPPFAPFLGEALDDPDRLLDPATVPPALRDAESMERLLPEWISLLTPAPGAAPAVVCDGLEAAVPEDLALIQRLVEAAQGEGRFRLRLLCRGGGQPPGGGSLPEVEIPPMAAPEMEEFARGAEEGLTLPPEVKGRLMETVHGHPFALEEGLMALVQLRLIRQIYGSFFFSGTPDTPYQPSERFIQHIEAEAGRLGDPIPLHLLALAEGPVAVPEETLRACHPEIDGARRRVASGWPRPFIGAGLVRRVDSPWGPGVALSCPAHGDALRATLPPDRADSLRRALGTSLGALLPRGAWHVYRLLAGSPAATAPLLAAARSGKVPPWELLTALAAELAQQRAAGGGSAEEMELLWFLLPLAHKLDLLADYAQELDRALELAREDPKKRMAFAGLKAKLEEQAGRLEEAEEALRGALEESAVAGGDARALLVLRLARVLIRQGRHDKARELLERVVPILEREGAPALAASGRFHLANIALHQHRLQEAFDLHCRVLAARRQLGRARPVGRSLSALGAVALRLGRYTEALDYYREAERIFLESGPEEETSFALLGIGRALSRLGDYMAAAAPLRRALALRQSGDVTGQALARLAAAENYLDLEQPHVALQEARRAHFDLSLHGEASLADAEQLLGRLLLRQRQFAEARRHLTLALNQHREGENWEGFAADLSWLLQVELAADQDFEVARLSAELEEALVRCGTAERREVLDYRLFEGLERLGRPAEGMPYLKRAYGELLRKTHRLPAALRHRFLFQIRDHEAIVRAATRRGLSLPEL